MSYKGPMSRGELKQAGKGQFSRIARDTSKRYTLEHQPLLNIPSLKVAGIAMGILYLTAALSGCVGTDAVNPPTGSYKDMALSGADELKAKCPAYAQEKVSGWVKFSPDTVMDGLCDNDINALEQKNADNPEKQLSPAPVAATPAQADEGYGATKEAIGQSIGGNVPYDPDGRGLLLSSIDGIDWSAPEVWYDLRASGSGFDAFGMKISGDDLYLLIVAHPGVDLDKEPNQVILKSGYGKERPHLNIAVFESKIMPLEDSSADLFEKYMKEGEIKSLNANIKQIKLKDFYKILRDTPLNDLTTLSLSTEFGGNEASNVLPSIVPIAKELKLSNQ